MSSSGVDSSSSAEGDRPVRIRGSWDRLPSERISADQRIWVAGHNRSVRRRLEPLLSEAERPATGPIDLALVVPETSEEWGYFSAKILPRLALGGEVGLVLADEEAESRRADHPTPPSYHDLAVAIGLSEKGIWVAASDLLIIRFAPATTPGPSQS